MRLVVTAAGFALALTSIPALAEDAKPNDAEIAHIAYTAGAIDIKAANWRCRSPRTKRCEISRRTWFMTIRRSTIRLWRW